LTYSACLEDGATVVSTFWGDPGPVRDVIRAAGALHLHTVGSVADAVLAAEQRPRGRELSPVSAPAPTSLVSPLTGVSAC
jgi:hypothetical protein